MPNKKKRNRKVTVSICLKQSVIRDLRQEAAEKDLSVSELVSRIIDRRIL